MIRSAQRYFRFGVSVLIGLAVAVVSAVVWSAPLPSGRIALLDSPESSPLARHCLTRIREELTSGGFEVSLVDAGSGSNPISTAATMRSQEGVVAVIALVGDPERRGAELWILDRIGAQPEVRRLPVPAEDIDRLPEVLAIRTMEILNASALQALLEATRPHPAPPAVAPSKPPPAVSESRSVVGLEAGISILESVGGVEPAALPLARVRAWLGDRSFARLTLAGLGTRPRFASSIGSASITQSVGLAEVGLALLPGARFRPTFTLGAGALCVHSEGQGSWPYAGLRQTRWAAALGGGFGLLARVDTRVSVALEISAVVAVPHPVVRFYDVESATLAFPAALASLTMVTWL
jgi:hypothetical protein